MLLQQDTRRKRLNRIGIQHGHSGLNNYRSGVKKLIHEVNRATGDADAVLECLWRCTHRGPANAGVTGKDEYSRTRLGKARMKVRAPITA